MKQFVVYLLSLVVCTSAVATPGPTPAPGSSTATASKAVLNAGAVRFQFNQIASSTKDSVLIIFDRFDHTGAGVVYQKYAADNAQGIDIAQVPAGKYYVVIQCQGLHHDRLEKVITIKAKKSEKVHIAFGESEEFSKNGVVIPTFRPDFSDMATR